MNKTNPLWETILSGKDWVERQYSQAVPLTWLHLPPGAWIIAKTAPALQKDKSPILHALGHLFKGLNI